MNFTLKTFYRALLGAATLAVLGANVACTNDDVHRYSIQAEPFATNGTKMAVSGQTASWVTGDAVKINNATASVVVDGGAAYLDADIQEANVYRAIYPASIAQSGTLDVDTVTVTLPNTYTYRESNGVQQLDLPMVAAGRTFPLTFKHLTAGIVVGITNSITYHPNSTTTTTTDEFFIEKIIVSSDNYSLSGSRRFDITNVDGIAVEQSRDADTAIVMNFPTGQISIAQNATKQIFIPVMPVGANNHFSITVNGYIKLVQSSGTVTNRSYAVKLTQQGGGAMVRNKLAFAPIELNDATRPDASMSLRHVGDTVYVLTADGMKMAFDSMRRKETWRAKHYVLQTDCNMGNISMYPIYQFKGTFNGNGHTIYNLTLNDTAIGNCRYFGLFTNPRSAITISDLTLNAVVRTKNTGSTNNDKITHYYGGLVGYSTLNLRIVNCTMQFAPCSDNVINAASSVTTIDFGGLIGYTGGGTTTITNSTVSFGNSTLKFAGYSTTKTNIYGAGLIGYATASATLVLQNNSVQDGTVAFSKYQNGYFAQYARMATNTTKTITGNMFSATFKDKNSSTVSLTDQNQ